jgi:hypothetical protein
MVSQNNKLKSLDLAFKEDHIVHLIFASLPKEFETFVVNYNSKLETWDIEKTIAMCVQEEERLKTANGGSINYVSNKKRNTNFKCNFEKGNPSSSKGKAPPTVSAAQAPGRLVRGRERPMSLLQR